MPVTGRQLSKICERCNAEYYRSRSYGNKQWEVRRFCSRACANRSNPPRPKKPCPDCGRKLILLQTVRCNSCDSAIKRKIDPRIQEYRADAKKRWMERNPNYWKQPHIREKARIRASIWANENPDSVRKNVRAAKMLRRAREANVEHDSQSIIVPWMMILSHDPCSYCENMGDSIDHIDPIVNGGGHVIDNLISSCRRCNSAKGPKSLLNFLLER